MITLGEADNVECLLANLLFSASVGSIVLFSRVAVCESHKERQMDRDSLVH